MPVAVRDNLTVPKLSGWFTHEEILWRGRIGFALKGREFDLDLFVRQVNARRRLAANLDIVSMSGGVDLKLRIPVESSKPFGGAN